MDDFHRVIETLVGSKLFNEFASAFREITEIRLCLESRASDQDQEEESPQHSSASKQSTRLRNIVTLTEGMYRIVVPIKHGARVVGVIQTGLILEEELVTPYSGNHLSEIPVVPRTKTKPLIRIIEVFADHLGVISNQLALTRQNCEPAFVTKARDYIHTHYSGSLRLSEVARHANVSSYHLCKMFKQITGLNFSNYLARWRIEIAKELLVKRSLRINEVALDSGFQSLNHFNRVFKKYVGESPRMFRDRATAFCQERLNEGQFMESKTQRLRNR